MAGNSVGGHGGQQQGLAETRSVQDGGKIEHRTDPKAHYNTIIKKTDTTSRSGGLRGVNAMTLPE